MEAGQVVKRAVGKTSGLKRGTQVQQARKEQTKRGARVTVEVHGVLEVRGRKAKVQG